MHLIDASGNTFDAQSIRGTYRVIDPVDIELPFYKEAATAPGSDKTHVIKDPSESIRLPRSDLDSLEINHADAICARMVGNSMAEKIEDGSIVAIDRGLTQIDRWRDLRNRARRHVAHQIPEPGTRQRDTHAQPQQLRIPG